MADFNLDFSGASGFTPHEGGGGSDFLNFQGGSFGKIDSITDGESQASGNKTMTFGILLTDEEQYNGVAAKGSRLVTTIPVTGMRKDKKSNIVRLLEVLNSAYSANFSDEESLQKVRALEGKQGVTFELIKKQLVGKEVWFDVHADEYTNKDGERVWNSKINNFITKAKYADLKNWGKHRKALPPRALQGTSAAPPQATAPAAAGTPANGAQSSAPQPTEQQVDAAMDII